MKLYHITDYPNLDSILTYGLLGNPIVYVTTSSIACLAIRNSQEKLYEKRKDVGYIIFEFDSAEYDLWEDPNCMKVNGQPVAFMLYADIPPTKLKIL